MMKAKYSERMGGKIMRLNYNSVGCNCEFVLYPGVGHELTNQMDGNVKSFLLQYR